MTESTIIIKVDESPRLIARANDQTLVLDVSPVTLHMGIPCPIGTGEANAASNVGGQVEVFRDLAGGVINLRTLRGVNDVSIAQVGDVVEISALGAGIDYEERATDPIPSDSGFDNGTIWTNTANGKSWVLHSNTPGAAEWSQVAGPAWIEDVFSPTVGQITFILSQAPTDSDSFSFSVNGVEYTEGPHFARSGLTVTWLNALFILAISDSVVARYR